MNRIIILVLLLGLLPGCGHEESTRWRGPAGNGIYPDTGLLREWPDEGPEILWTYEGLGKGHSSAVVQNGKLFTAGMIDSTGYLFKFNLDGDLVYKVPYGLEFTKSYYGTRGTPVIVGDKVYLESGRGKLICFGNEDGAILWSKELFSDFDGINIRWGNCETPVVDENRIYVTPGGKKNNVIALDRHTGDLIWSCEGKGELSAYCTPLLFEHNGRKILTTHTASHLLGIDALTGELLWSEYLPGEWSIHSNTPIYNSGEIYYQSGHSKGGGLLSLNADGDSVSLIWENNLNDYNLGGAVLIDGYIYGSYDGFEGKASKFWRCVRWDSGEEMYLSHDLASGNVIYADGMLYCYTSKGDLALVTPDPGGFNVVSKTKVSYGTAQHLAHPIIEEGVLYIRHGDALIAYKI